MTIISIRINCISHFISFYVNDFSYTRKSQSHPHLQNSRSSMHVHLLFRRIALSLLSVQLKDFLLQALGNQTSFHFTHTEPVGFKAPVFNSESKISLFEKPMSANVALFCQAQAYPVPMIR